MSVLRPEFDVNSTISKRYLKEKRTENIDLDEAFRVLRFFYVRYKNFSRAVSSLKQTVGMIDINGVFDTLSQDTDAFDVEDFFDDVAGGAGNVRNNGAFFAKELIE